MLPDAHDVTVDSMDERPEATAPTTYLKVDLTEDASHDLAAWLHLHLVAIQAEMQPILKRFQQEQDQVDGNMPGADYPYSGAFRINYPVTRRKVREICNRIKQAYLDSDPIWGINLDDPALFELATKVEKSLDTAMEHQLDEDDDLMLALWDATKHGTGVLIPNWLYQEERVRDLEAFAGVQQDAFLRGEIELPQAMQGLLDFESQYPNWQEEKDLRALRTQLLRGQDVEREITKTVVVRNHPDFQHVEIARVRVYPTVKGYEGLRTTPIYGFVSDYTRFELEALAAQGVIDEDALGRLLPATESERDEDATDPEAQQESFEIFQGTIRYKLPGDPTPSRYKVWYAVDEQIVLRTRFFPWWYHEADMIPFYVRLETPGFFKTGVADDVVDEHTVLNALLNMYLNAIDLANSMRWKAKYKSLGYAQILSKRWSPHLPAPWKDNPNEIESLATPTNHLSAIVAGFELLRRQSDEATGTSSLQSGRESPTDPTAPGIKTIALLQQVQPNEKDVLRALEPSFRHMGVWTLQLYYQGLKMAWIDELPDGLQLPPAMLPEIAQRLHPRAMLFEVDRQGRFDRNVGLLQLTTNLLGNSRPDVVLKMLRVIIQQAGSPWDRLVDSLDLERPMPLPVPGAEGDGAPSGPTPSDNGHATADSPISALVNRLSALGVA